MRIKFILLQIEDLLLPEAQKKYAKECRLLVLTNDDLYTEALKNFVFGLGTGSIGLWSKARFGDPKVNAKAFEKCLLRMMKISAHEFGHMRGLPHCTDYDCNMGGYMSLTELDNRPLTYCARDSAKICSLGQTSFLKYHKKLLRFFQGFNRKYGLNFDFSKEVSTLKGRIEALDPAQVHLKK